MADTKISALTELVAPVDADELAIVDTGAGATKRVLNQHVGMLKKVGTALIGGDFTGDARGTLAIDIQTDRSLPAQVASGNYALAIGQSAKASGYKAAAIGYAAEASAPYALAVGNVTANAQGAVGVGYRVIASGVYAVAIGYDPRAVGVNSVAIGKAAKTKLGADYGIAIGAGAYSRDAYSIAIGSATNPHEIDSIAIGRGATTYGIKANALGKYASARISYTTVIVGPQIVTKGDGTGTPAVEFVAAEMMLFTDVVDLTAVADVTLTIPTGAHFWLNEVGVIATIVDTMTLQPIIRYGITGSLAKQHAAAITTLLTAAFKRESFIPLVPQDGEATLTAGVTVGATATELKGRFYFKGLLVEDQ